MPFSTNFSCYEQRAIAAGTVTSMTTLTNAFAVSAGNYMVTNEGANAVQIAWGVNPVTALASASAGGTQQIKVPGGAIMTLGKPPGAAFCAAITDTLTAIVTIMVGQGN